MVYVYRHYTNKINKNKLKMNAAENNLEIWQTNDIERVCKYIVSIGIFTSEMKCNNEKANKGCFGKAMILKPRLGGDGIQWRCSKCKAWNIYVFIYIFKYMYKY